MAQVPRGKGVATLMGVVLALHWPSALVYAVVWLGLLALLRVLVARRHDRGGRRTRQRGLLRESALVIACCSRSR